jgi:hypothetical protein
MKSTYVLLSLALMLVFSSFIHVQEGTPLDGSWKLRDFDYGGNKGSNRNPGLVKMFGDGKFGTYVLSSDGAKKTTDGIYKVLDENFYTETILDAVNSPMKGKTYKIKYQIKDSLLIMSGTYDSPQGQVNYSETWVKVNPKILASIARKISGTD